MSTETQDVCALLVEVARERAATMTPEQWDAERERQRQSAVQIGRKALAEGGTTI